MTEYTAQDYTDMIMLYGVTGGNAHAAARLYVERFLGRKRHPDYNVILRCIRCVRETGSVLPTQQGIDGLQPVRINEERILRAFEKNPRNSIRCVARAFNISRHVVHHVLRQNGLHSYHFQQVQQLLAGDAEQRVYFCNGLTFVWQRKFGVG